MKNKEFPILLITCLVLFGCCAFVSAAPPVTTGLQLWLDASNTASITAAGGSLTNNSRITAWNDVLVGDNSTADNAVQTAEANEPIWISAVPAINGHSVVRFDGIHSFLNLSTLNIGANTTILIVCLNAVQSTGGSAHRPLLAADDDPFRTSGDGYGISMTTDATLYVGLADVGYDPDYIEEPFTQDYSYGAIIFRRDTTIGNGAQLYKRGLGDANNVLLGSNQFYRTSGFHTGYVIGANPPENGGGDPTRFYFGDIAEILIYNRALSDAELKSVSDYVAGKYLVPTACGHPLIAYKAGDINHDCRVNLADVAILAQSWMACTSWTDLTCGGYMPAAEAQQRWNTWRKTWTTFPIAAWAYFDRFLGTLSEYQTYANANLTMVQAPLGTQFSNAVAAGLKPIIGSWQTLYSNNAKLQYYVNYPSAKDTSVPGYFLMDEPADINTMKLLGTATQYIYYNDQRNAIPMVDLKPTYGSLTNFASYNDYVSSYVSMVTPAVLLYDHYPILADGTDRADFYSNMEIIRQNALAAGIGFMGFALVTSYVDTPDTRQPSESDLNWEVYSLITYGAKGIWYYNYRINPATGSGYGPALVTYDTDTPTATYTMASAINADLKAMGPTLLKLQSGGVYHTGTTPTGATAYSNGVIPVISSFVGSNFLLSKSTNMDNAADTDSYVMIMNKNHSATTTSAQQAANAVFSAAPTTLKVYKYNTSTNLWDLQTGSSGTYTINIGGGKMVLLRFSTN
jgi:hypothetical protein